MKVKVDDTRGVVPGLPLHSSLQQARQHFVPVRIDARCPFIRYPAASVGRV